MVNTATKRDVIVDGLRRLIVSGELERGSRLPQDELAKRFNSSITPVREALRVLEAEGLVVSAPHRGTRVAGIDLDRVKATYIVRRLTESYAMRRAATRFSLRDIKRAQELLLKIEDAAAAGNELRVRQANRDFHFYFYDRSGIPGLSDHLALLWASFPWDLVIGAPDRAEASRKEHHAILEAVRAGDPDRAAAAVETHIAHGFLPIARRISGEDVLDPFDPDTD
ncbi:GntR family transcriptional regulator [Micromonospora olivasterospora]|uniref:DNA-binding GntR family transcriptional regulator n=1 Tax=Micromonospora olivasterospora TaxID=1880 RepID=A0A562IJB1_MICOL|nr:GntR family transcriptional regulator [Micromonospora olivasterospora]TWH70972.1 DNA-binding GntR family transcriptional regulator [Micromonospora olivasterospora]